MPDSVFRRPSRSYTGVGQVAFLVPNSHLGKKPSHPRSRQVSGPVSRKPLWVSCGLAYERRRHSWTGETVTAYSDSSPSSVHTTDFAYDGNQIALQFDKDGAGNVAATDMSHRYLYGPAVDQVLADERVTVQNGTLATSEVLYPLTDAQGTVRDVALLSGTTTTVVDHITYSGFGAVVSQTNSSQGSLFGNAGRPTDPATGLENDRARIYDAALMRFISEDPTYLTAGDTNVDRYCGNDPVNATDPSGLADETTVETLLKDEAHYTCIVNGELQKNRPVDYRIVDRSHGESGHITVSGLKFEVTYEADKSGALLIVIKNLYYSNITLVVAREANEPTNDGVELRTETRQDMLDTVQHEVTHLRAYTQPLQRVITAVAQFNEWLAKNTKGVHDEQLTHIMANDASSEVQSKVSSWLNDRIALENWRQLLELDNLSRPLTKSDYNDRLKALVELGNRGKLFTGDNPEFEAFNRLRDTADKFGLLDTVEHTRQQYAKDLRDFEQQTSGDLQNTGGAVGNPIA